MVWSPAGGGVGPRCSSLVPSQLGEEPELRISTVHQAPMMFPLAASRRLP